MPPARQCKVKRRVGHGLAPRRHGGHGERQQPWIRRCYFVPHGGTTKHEYTQIDADTNGRQEPQIDTDGRRSTRIRSDEARPVSSAVSISANQWLVLSFVVSAVSPVDCTRFLRKRCPERALLSREDSGPSADDADTRRHERRGTRIGTDEHRCGQRRHFLPPAGPSQLTARPAALGLRSLASAGRRRLADQAGSRTDQGAGGDP